MWFSGQFVCPPKDGQYEDEFQCDKYYVCEDGVAEEMLCKDGLVFDPFKRSEHKCNILSNVDCGDRLEMQEPQPSKNCRRQNGYFQHPDDSNCHQFVNCIDGQGTINTCPANLLFNEKKGVCQWPADAGRSGCVREETLEDGFSCPLEKQFNPDGTAEAHPRYPHPTNCQKFYICLNGITPRETGCATGEVYNSDSKQCDQPENVEDCATWYDDVESPATAA